MYKSYVSNIVLIASILFTPASARSQSSYDPSTTASFSEATAGMSVINSYRFGTGAGSNVSNLQQLSDSFNPYGIAGTIVIHQEWERYQAFNTSNFDFGPSTLNLTATIPSGGGLYAGGINSGQIWSKQTYKPGGTGQNVYAISVRMKIPKIRGSWPAIWLYSPNGGDGSEVDITEFEVMQYQNEYDWTGFNHGPNVGSAFYSLLTNPWVWHPGTDFSAGFHDYQLVWTPGSTFKYVDGKLVYAQYFKWNTNSPAQLGVNLAIGSNESGLPGLIPNSIYDFPSALQVQSITILGGSGAAAPTTPTTPTTPTAPTTPTPPTTPTTPTSSAATYAGSDTTTQGTWTGKYGTEGYMIADGNSSPPSYAAVSISGQSTYTWERQTGEVRALQSQPSSGTRLASTYYSYNPFTYSVKISDGNTHRVALYLLDWDSNVRVETIAVKDAASGSVLDSKTFSNFSNGQYAIWDVKGNVNIEVTPAASNGVVSGLFFGPAGTVAPGGGGGSTTASASYSGLDTSTQGNWNGKYGADGRLFAAGPQNVPSYATLDATNVPNFVWSSWTNDVRALKNGNGSYDRWASAFTSNSSFDLKLNLSDGNTHRISLYLLDWDFDNRSETISIIDASTGTVLDKRTFSNFTGGQYAVWNVKGNVIVRVAPPTYGYTALNAVFFN